MSRRPLRVATTRQLESAARQAGFDTYVLPDEINTDPHRAVDTRLQDGPVYRAFLERHDIELLLDYNAGALTFVPSAHQPGVLSLTSSMLGIPHVACYLDAITATMDKMAWVDHWGLLECAGWIKGVPDMDLLSELSRLGIQSLLHAPLGISLGDVHVSAPRSSTTGPPVAFMGHPATSWFHKNMNIGSGNLFAGMLAAAVRSDAPQMLFHEIYYDLYELAKPPEAIDDVTTRANKAADYFTEKFAYNAYLALRHRDRFIRFLKLKLGDAFELIGDYWAQQYGLKQSPRIWDRQELLDRMRSVPICLNMIKGCGETGLAVRHFEITAAGGFMLCYETAELADYFEIGEECDVFHSEAELLEKIEYYLAHPKRRDEIAAAGQQRTLSSYQQYMRLAQLVDDLREVGLLPSTGMQDTDQADPRSIETCIPPPFPPINPSHQHCDPVISETH